MMRARVCLAALAAFATSACISLDPELPKADPQAASAFPVPGNAQEGNPPINGVAFGTIDADVGSDVRWQDFYTDPALRQLIATALANNRDLRVAVLNVERARGLYQIQRADRVPTITADASAQRAAGYQQDIEVYGVTAGLSAFELDLFGRVRSLTTSALQQYFAQAEARAGAQLSLVAEVANAYLTLAADQELLTIARNTLASQEETYGIFERQHQAGYISGLDLAQARTEIEVARADVANFADAVERDRNALTLLVGTPIDPALLPEDFSAQVTAVAPLPIGMPSEVLLRRPDVRAAEFQLKATNANIGAARAAFFPRITLTGNAGTVSGDLSDLFSGGTRAWSFIPQISVPIFEGGRLTANLDVAKTDRDIALAQYERSIQASFKEVADALGRTAWLAKQRSAREDLLVAATRADELALARYKAGLDNYVTRLISHRTFYLAQQSLVIVRLAEQSNRVTLYRVLGGGWNP